MSFSLMTIYYDYVYLTIVLLWHLDCLIFLYFKPWYGEHFVSLLNSLCMVASVTFTINEVSVQPMLLPGFHRWGAWDSERWSHLPRVTQQGNGGTSFQILICLAPKPVLIYTCTGNYSPWDRCPHSRNIPGGHQTLLCPQALPRGDRLIEK